MSEPTVVRTPQVVAQELDISSATLRRWADEFSEYLSAEASSAQGRSHRRYTEQDIQTLQLVKELMHNGLTYEQVRQQLSLPSSNSSRSTGMAYEFRANNSGGEAVEQPLGFDEEAVDADEERALVAPGDAESPAIAFLTNTLATLSDTQQSILNSQAANRELLGVLIQDNFNLKEENNRLRERILEVERNLAQRRQEDEWRRESIRQEMEAKIGTVQQMAVDAIRTAQSVQMPEIKAIKNKPGCLGALFGAGDTQIVTVPRKRTRRAQPQSSYAAGASPPPAQHASPGVQSPAIHPKPMAPPE